MGSASILVDDDNEKLRDVVVIPCEYLHWKSQNPFNIMALKTIFLEQEMRGVRFIPGLRYEMEITVICRTRSKAALMNIK